VNLNVCEKKLSNLKKRKKNGESLKDLCDNINHTNRCIMESKKENEEKLAEKCIYRKKWLKEEIMKAVNSSCIGKNQCD
jgi:hypothetical protein